MGSEYLLTSKEFIFFAGYLRLAMNIPVFWVSEITPFMEYEPPMYNHLLYNHL